MPSLPFEQEMMDLSHIRNTHKTFSVPVDKRSRKAMEAYLGGHFRYDTMNSWNRATSYACNMKVDPMAFDGEISDKLLDMVEVTEFYDELGKLIQAFNQEHDYLWQAGWNGRSGGYLVLYQGQLQPTQHRSYCTSCGQKNFESVSKNGKRCGVCGKETRVDFIAPPMQIVTYPGRGTDQGEDFSEWSLSELQQRTALVQEFDRLADDIASRAIELAQTCDVAEDIEYVPVTRLRLA